MEDEIVDEEWVDEADDDVESLDASAPLLATMDGSVSSMNNAQSSIAKRVNEVEATHGSMYG